MSKSVLSFRIALEIEIAERRPFPNALDKSERKAFDEMWDIPKLYVMACSGSCQLVPLQPIMIPILFHHYKELKKCISEVEMIEKKRVNNNNNNSNKEKVRLTIEKEEKAPIATTINLNNFLSIE